MTQLVWSLPSLSSAVVLCVFSQSQLCSQPGQHLHRDLPGGSARSRSINYSRRMNLLCAITFPSSSLTPSQLHEQAWIYPLPRNGLQIIWMTGVWSGYFCCSLPMGCSQEKRASCWIPGPELRTCGLKSCFQEGICVCLAKEYVASFWYFTILGTCLLNK